MTPPELNVNPAIARSNPFSTRFIRPGAVDYLLPDDTSWREILAQLVECRRCFVEGPHGAGKSTFLRAMIKRWVDDGADQGKSATLVRIGPDRKVSERVNFGQKDSRPNPSGKHLICIDGWSHWSWFHQQRMLFSRHTLVVTTHQAIRRWRRLHHPQTSLTTFQAIVRELQGDVVECQQVSEAIVESTFSGSGGNLREALFALYDEFQLQTGGAST